jgi:hypothetical protein
MRTEQVQTTHLTRGRETTISFDYTETILTQPWYIHRRRGEQMEPSATSGVIRLSSGAWILRPLNDPLTGDTTVENQYAMRLTDFYASGIVKEITRGRRLSELTGVSPHADVATTGDYYFIKRIGAGATWSNAIVVGDPKPTLPTALYPLDRLAFGNPLHDADTGYLLKLIIPGNQLAIPDYFFGFSWGGILTEAGYGKWYLALSGDGHAKLFERVEGAWVEKADWRWVPPAQVPGGALILRILPHLPRFLELTALSPGIVPNLLHTQTEDLLAAIRAGRRDPGSRSTYLHEITDRPDGNLTPEQFYYPISGNGHVTVDVRRDVRMEWAISRLAYGSSGTIQDRGFNLPYGVTDEHVVRAEVNAWVTYVNGTQVVSVTPTIKEADGTALVADTESFTFNGVARTLSGWNPPGGLNQLRCDFLLENTGETTNNKWHTPVFLGYHILRNGHTQTHSPTLRVGFGKCQEVSITGPGFRADEESASLRIEDLSNDLAILRVRGGVGIQISVTPASGDIPIIAFEGYTGRVTASQRGKSGKTFPSPNWHSLDIECAGKWDRLQGLFFSQQFDFQDSITSPEGRETGLREPWRVTSALRYILMMCGFPDSQILITDEPMRLFANPATAPETNLMPNPSVNVSDWIGNLASSYLNAAVYFDANALTTGAWRLKKAPVSTDTPVWNFVTTRPTAGRITHIDAAYAANTSPILSRLDRIPIRPEFNVIVVRGVAKAKPGGAVETLQAVRVNKKSFNSPLHPATADPNSADYIGRMVGMELHDTTLDTQEAVNFACNRRYNLAGRGRALRSFISAYTLIPAATLEPGVYTFRLKRPLLPLDLITIDTDRYVVRSCNPHWEKSGIMRQMLEAEKIEEDLVYG